MKIKKYLFLFGVFLTVPVIAMQRLGTSQWHEQSDLDLSELERVGQNRGNPIEQLTLSIRARISALQNIPDATIIAMLRDQKDPGVVPSLLERLKAIPEIRRGSNNGQSVEAQLKQLDFTTQLLALFAEHNGIQKSIFYETKRSAAEALAVSKQANTLSQAAHDFAASQSKSNGRQMWIMFLISAGINIAPIVMSIVSLVQSGGSAACLCNGTML